MSDSEKIVRIPVTGLLDLHAFLPKEVTDLVTEYIFACAMEKIYVLRLIHGKGTGRLRRTVHTTLKSHPLVESFHLADESSGGWGATIVYLKKEG